MTRAVSACRDSSFRVIELSLSIGRAHEAKENGLSSTDAQQPSIDGLTGISGSKAIGDGTIEGE